MDPEGWLQNCLDSVEVSQINDVSETIWGKYLLDDFFIYLDAHIRVMEKCIKDAEECPGFEKPVIVLKDMLYQLTSLRNSSTWDEVIRKKGIDYGRLTFPRKNPDPQLSDRIKEARTACKKGLEKRLKYFSDPSSQLLLDLQQSSAATRGLICLVKQFTEKYKRIKSKEEKRTLCV
jgi:ATP-dependent helicase/nuclease subunit A